MVHFCFVRARVPMRALKAAIEIFPPFPRSHPFCLLNRFSSFLSFIPRLGFFRLSLGQDHNCSLIGFYIFRVWYLSYFFRFQSGTFPVHFHYLVLVFPYFPLNLSYLSENFLSLSLPTPFCLFPFLFSLLRETSSFGSKYLSSSHGDSLMLLPWDWCNP